VDHNYQKDISGCGLSGIINKKKGRISGDHIKRSLCLMNDWGNSLGAGFAAYGIYPEFEDFYAFHVMYDDPGSRLEAEEYLKQNFRVEKTEEIPTAPVETISISPMLLRYFIKPRPDRLMAFTLRPSYTARIG